MTILVGVLCQDGVVIGADGSVTFAAGQNPTIEQPTQKIDIIDGSVILVGTGEVGLGQRFSAITEQALKAPDILKLSAIDRVTHLSHHALKNFSHTFVQPNAVPYGALLAFFANGQPYLCEFQLHNMRPELKTDRLWYCSMGGGQMIVDPFLGLIRKVFWDSGPPTIQEGIFATTWALRHAIDCNTGGINEPIQIAVLAKNDHGDPKARLLDGDELQEHRENVDGAVEHLRDYRNKLKGDQAAIPDVPKP